MLRTLGIYYAVEAGAIVICIAGVASVIGIKKLIGFIKKKFPGKQLRVLTKEEFEAMKDDFVEVEVVEVEGEPA